MSKITQEKKAQKLKGKAKKIAESKAKKTAEPTQEPEVKPSVLNGDRCCHCKHYKKYDICGHYCDVTNKPTPRKSTCKKHAFKL